MDKSWQQPQAFSRYGLLDTTSIDDIAKLRRDYNQYSNYDAELRRPVARQPVIDLDWTNLSKVEIAERIFEPDIFEAYARPDAFRDRFYQLADREKSLVEDHN